MTDSDHTASEPSAPGSPAPGDLLTLHASRRGSAAVVTVVGELDLQTARELMAVVDDTLQWPDLTALVIDLTGVGFLGSSGLGTLAEIASRTTTTPGPGYSTQAPTPRPALRLVAPPDNLAVIRPWETMNLQQILPLLPDVDTALADL
ncbi:STAS domain-containing protein [Pseudonocardia xinjiangensis]|uniref:STAS domain-containing protein n=1 Tax=Pseudonocardia xinjiangensis TaxID=75289 RepID=A0ABX1RA65_9PSEU|nr:STAS domain-containing protein [Pseudonocardia xinjiangensis]NMH76061.1 STAS domain-containing protein [Pseudonocardia xinjiangensis]